MLGCCGDSQPTVRTYASARIQMGLVGWHDRDRTFTLYRMTRFVRTLSWYGSTPPAYTRVIYPAGSTGWELERTGEPAPPEWHHEFTRFSGGPDEVSWSGPTSVRGVRIGSLIGVPGEERITTDIELLEGAGFSLSPLIAGLDEWNIGSFVPRQWRDGSRHPITGAVTFQDHLNSTFVARSPKNLIGLGGNPAQCLDAVYNIYPLGVSLQAERTKVWGVRGEAGCDTAWVYNADNRTANRMLRCAANQPTQGGYLLRSIDLATEGGIGIFYWGNEGALDFSRPSCCGPIQNPAP